MTNEPTTTITITPEMAAMLLSASKRHDKPPDVLIEMAIRAMYAATPPTARKRKNVKSS